MKMTSPEIKSVQHIQVPKVQITSPAHASKQTHESNPNTVGVLISTPRSSKRKSHTPGTRSRAIRPQADPRAVSVITFAGPTRAVATKRDMKQVFFDKE